MSGGQRRIAEAEAPRFLGGSVTCPPQRPLLPGRSPSAPHDERAQVQRGDQSHPRSPLSVLRTDNRLRVRDGYIRSTTRGYARTRLTRRNAPICRSNAIFDARPCTRVPPENLHGKEGVDGSSPSEGLKDLQISRFRCLFRHDFGDDRGGGQQSPVLRAFPAQTVPNRGWEGTLREQTSRTPALPWTRCTLAGG